MDQTSIKPNLYAYRSPTNFIEDYFTYLKATRPDLSLRKWTIEMGFESPNYLIDVLKGKRHLKLSHTDRFVSGLNLDPSQLNFFKALVLRSRLTSDEEKEVMEILLKSYMPVLPELVHRVSEQEIFSSVMDSFIVELIKIKNKKWTEDSIKTSLSDKMDTSLLHERLEKLSQAGLIKTNQDGSISHTFQVVSSRTDSPNSNFRQYYIEANNLASEAATLSVDQREFQCFSMAMPAESLIEVKDILRNLRARLEAYGSSPDASSVYQFNLQCFPVVNVN